MTTWSFGSVALSTFGRVTLMNSYFDMPEKRGDNITIPFHDGDLHVNKYFGKRTLTFRIAIEKASALALESTMDTLRALLSKETEQTLSSLREDGTIRTALASVGSQLQIERHGSKILFHIIDFVLADPLFRSDTLYQVTSDAVDGTPTPTALTVVNSGTAKERNPTLLLTGPLRNTVITNTTNGVALTYTGTIAGGATVTIGTLNKEYYATHSGSGAVIGNVTHTGAASLMELNTGNNAVTIADADYAGGTVRFSFYSPYL